MVITRSVFGDSWHVRVEKPHAEASALVKWCLQNVKLNHGECPTYGKFAWSHQNLGSRGINFTFGREQDAVRFVLRWS